MAAGRAKSRNSSTNGASPLLATPDVLGTDGRAEVLARLLQQAAARVFELEAIQVANKHDDDDPVAGYPVTRPDGTVNSYRLCIREARDQEQRLAEKFPELIDRVRELIAQRSP
jgi:hypothetical protein